jgi:hypothetical protein
MAGDDSSSPPHPPPLLPAPEDVLELERYRVEPERGNHSEVSRADEDRGEDSEMDGLDSQQTVAVGTLGDARSSKI